MLLVSQIVDLACRLRGPRFAHFVHLRRLERWRTYEPEFYLLDHLVDPDRAAVDVGANEGIYSGRMAQLCSRVHCFEPIPWLARELRDKLGETVVIHESALSSKPGVGELRIPYNGSVQMHGWSTVEADNPLSGSTHSSAVACHFERLDDVVGEPVGFIKIDVEGHELAVLEGAKRVLRADRPILLIESEKRHNAKAPEVIFEFLEKFGYAGFFLKGHRLTGLPAFDPDTDQRVENIGAAGKGYINNFIFIPGR